MSQGLLEALFEFQLAITSFTSLDTVTSSHYDGATALSEACLMAVRSKNIKKILVDESLNELYRRVLLTYCDAASIQIEFVSIEKVSDADLSSSSAFVAQYPGFKKSYLDLQRLNKIASSEECHTVLSVDPLFLPDFDFNLSDYADIVTMEGQSLGIHMFAGGAHIGILACKNELRQFVPGRLVGEVTDINGDKAYALVFEDREQHVARDKATSNICSNQALNALRVGIYLRLIGKKGLIERLSTARRNVNVFQDALRDLPNVNIDNDFKNRLDFLVEFDDEMSCAQVREKLLENDILFGVGRDKIKSIPQAGLFVCVTETKSLEQLQKAIDVIYQALSYNFKFELLLSETNSEDFSHLSEEDQGETEISIVRRYTHFREKTLALIQHPILWALVL